MQTLNRILYGGTGTGKTETLINTYIDLTTSENTTDFLTMYEYYKEDVYGNQVEVIPRVFIRGERKFESLESLTRQIEEDISEAKKKCSDQHQ